MSNAKEEVKSMLEKLPDDCSLEDIQYHLYVVEKIHRGIDRAEKEGTLSREEVEEKMSELPRASAKGFPGKFLPPQARTEPVNVKCGVIIPIRPETAQWTIMHPLG